MKKTTVCFIAAALMLQAAPLCLHASAADSVKVNVTLTALGTIKVAAEELTVTDIDKDGKLTLNDALVIAHDNYFGGGSSKGFASAVGEWGLSITKLWGLTNNGNFMYTLNNEFVTTDLTAEITDGDWFYAYALKEADYSDVYTFFEGENGKKVQDAKAGETIDLTLKNYSYDASFNTISEPLAGAVITVNGKETTYKTDADGKVSVPLDEAGTAIISATYDGKTIVPPIAKVNVAQAETTTAAETTSTATTTTTTATTTTTTVTTTTTTSAATTVTTTTTKKTTTTTKATTTKAGATTKAGSTTAAAAKTGDSTAIPALAVTGVLALGAAYAMRRRDA